MPFDPDAYLASKSQTPAPQAGPSPAPAFDPDKYLAQAQPKSNGFIGNLLGLPPVGWKPGASDRDISAPQTPQERLQAQQENKDEMKRIVNQSSGGLLAKDAPPPQGSIDPGYYLGKAIPWAVGGEVAKPVIGAAETIAGPASEKVLELASKVPYGEKIASSALDTAKTSGSEMLKGASRGFLYAPTPENSRAANAIKGGFMGLLYGKALSKAKGLADKVGFLKDLFEDTEEGAIQAAQAEAEPGIKTVFDPFTKEEKDIKVSAPATNPKAGFDPFTKKPLK